LSLFLSNKTLSAEGVAMSILKLVIVTILTFVVLLSCGKSTEESQNVAKTENESPGQKVSENFAEKSVDELMSKNITNFLTLNYLKDDLQFLSENDRKFQFYKIDLNEDGKEEYFVRFMSSYFCGSGGCTFLLLDRYAEVINKFTVMDAPIYISKDKTNGWKKLIVQSGGKFIELIFDGKSYPSNPSVVAVIKTQPDSGFEILFDDKNLPAKTYTF
jgi:preprotein translocase subunit SecG